MFISGCILQVHVGVYVFTALYMRLERIPHYVNLNSLSGTVG